MPDRILQDGYEHEMSDYDIFPPDTNTFKNTQRSAVSFKLASIYPYMFKLMRLMSRLKTYVEISRAGMSFLLPLKIPLCYY